MFLRIVPEKQKCLAPWLFVAEAEMERWNRTREINEDAKEILATRRSWMAAALFPEMKTAAKNDHVNFAAAFIPNLKGVDLPNKERSNLMIA